MKETPMSSMIPVTRQPMLKKPALALMLAASLLSIAPAFAKRGNEGPMGSPGHPQRPDQTRLRYTYSGGLFVPPGSSPNTKECTILVNSGRVNVKVQHGPAVG